MVTRCEFCEHLHPDSRRDRREATAMCMKHPRIVRADLVFERVVDKDPPYMYARHINGGACPLFEPKKETENA